LIKGKRLSRKAYWLLLAGGLALALLSLAALAYALAPVETVRDLAPIAPTLLAPP
jgi:hypothetical protein